MHEQCVQSLFLCYCRAHLNEGSILAMYVRAYVRVCHTQECQFALICTHVYAQELMGRALTMEVKNREERRFLTMEDMEDSMHEQCVQGLFPIFPSLWKIGFNFSIVLLVCV